MRTRTLHRFERRLRALQQRVEEDFEGLRDAIGHEVSHDGEPSRAPTHKADADVEGLEVELIMTQTEGEILAATEDALCRIEEGTYGICEECGEPIGEKRLWAIPYTTRCIRCA